MSDERELVVQENVQLGALQVPPEAVIERASGIATVLADVINKRELYKVIRGRKYVLVEGWTTLGAVLGVTPRTVEVKELAEGAFEATVELVRNSDGAIIGRGIAECGADEPTWQSRPRYARKSMAITRATGKAFRLSFSWIMKLAGFEPTPAEEMPEVIDAEPVKKPERPLSPEDLRDALHKKVNSLPPRKAVMSVGERGRIRGAMADLFTGHEDKGRMVHAMLLCLWDRASSGDLMDQELDAMAAWMELGPYDPNEPYLPPKYVIEEALAAAEAGMRQLEEYEARMNDE